MSCMSKFRHTKKILFTNNGDYIKENVETNEAHRCRNDKESYYVKI